jgi:hypothetical protein
MKAEELALLTRHSTIVLERMLEQKVSLLDSLAEDPELENKALDLTFVDTGWPKELRESYCGD